MISIEEACKFSLRVEEKLNKMFENKKSGQGQGGRSSRLSYGGQNEDHIKNNVASCDQHQRDYIYKHYTHTHTRVCVCVCMYMYVYFRDQNNRDQRGGRGQGPRGGAFHRTCFHCVLEGHKAYGCPQ